MTEAPTRTPPDTSGMRHLHRPIVFAEPERIAAPASWLDHTPFAFWIVDALRPTTLVELGCQSGNSYASFAQGVQTLGLSTACYAVDTWKGDPHAGFFDESIFDEWSAYHDRRFSAFSRLIRATFEEAVGQFADASIDLLHIDGYHTFGAISHDFETWRPKLSERAVVLCHDINVRERDFGVWRFWEGVKDEYPSFEFLHGHGLGVLGIGTTWPDPVQWLLSLRARGGEANAVRLFFARLGASVTRRYASLTAEQEAAARIAARDAQIAALEQERAGRADQMAQDADEVTRLRDSLAEREADCDELRGAVEKLLAAKVTGDAEAAGLRAALEDRASRVQSLEAGIASREELLRQLHRDLADRAAWTCRTVDTLIAARPTGGAEHLAPVVAAVEALAARHKEVADAIRAARDEFRQGAVDVVAAVREIQAAAATTREPQATGPVPPDGRGAVTAGAPGVRTRLASLEYRRLIARVQEIVRETLPAKATVLVISKGDDALLEFDGRRGWRFPQTERGVYAGHYPADSAAAIAHFEALRAKGAEFLLLPSTAFWWLDSYPDFRTHLDAQGTRVWHDADCIIYRVSPSAAIPDGVSAESRHSLDGFARARLRAFLFSAARISFPAESAPAVSVVVPTFNQAHYTYLLLESLRAHTDVPFEVIVVDNASTDETASLLKRLDNARIQLNERNLGFGGACNLGARMARAESVCFLNSDTVVTPGWLRALTHTFEDRRCGAAAARLVHPDGRLQEAGSIIWQDGSTEGYGRGEDPFAPEYSYARPVDYGSAACLLVRRELFDTLGGFDDRYAPAYYEDADLCLRLRQAGWSIRYQPRATVFHLEFGSSGAGRAVALQQRQRATFIARWRDELADQRPSGSNVLWARDCRRSRRVLVVDDRLPLSVLGSGFPRTRLLLDALVSLGYLATYLPRTDPTPHEPVTSELQQAGIEVLHSVGDIRAVLARRENLYDLAIVSRPHNAAVIDLIREFNPAAPVIYDAEAVGALRDARQALAQGRLLPAGELDDRVRAELTHVAAADLVMAVSPAECRVFKAVHPSTPVVVWGYPARVQPDLADFGRRSDVLFVGNLSTPPNADAVHQLLTDIFPRIRRELDARLFVVGATPTADALDAALAQTESVVLTGFVNDLAPVFATRRVFVAPHRFAAGIPIKVIEAMSHGVPCVVSPLLAEQLELTDGVEALVGENAADFAGKVVRLYRDRDVWNQIQQQALRWLRERSDPAAMQAQLGQWIEEAIARKRGRAPKTIARPEVESI